MLAFDCEHRNAPARPFAEPVASQNLYKQSPFPGTRKLLGIDDNLPTDKSRLPEQMSQIVSGEVVQMPSAPDKGVGRRMGKSSFQNKLQNVSEVADIRSRHHEPALRPQHPMQFSQETMRIDHVFNDLQARDTIEGPVLVRKRAGIQIRADGFHASLLYFTERLFRKVASMHLFEPAIGKSYQGAIPASDVQKSRAASEYRFHGLQYLVWRRCPIPALVFGGQTVRPISLVGVLKRGHRCCHNQSGPLPVERR